MDPQLTSLLARIRQLPEGYSEGVYKHARYGITRQTFNQGRSYKVFARELGGKNFISLNFYVQGEKLWLKPCEMSEQKVADFLNEVRLV